MIRAMITPHSTPALGVGTTSAKSAHDSGQWPEEVGVYFMRNGQLTQMEPEIVGWKTGGVMKQYATLGIDKRAHQWQGHETQESVPCRARSSSSIKTPEGTSATEYQLLRLYEKDNRRESARSLAAAPCLRRRGKNVELRSLREGNAARMAIRLDGLERGRIWFLPPE